MWDTTSYCSQAFVCGEKSGCTKLSNFDKDLVVVFEMNKLSTFAGDSEVH